jgi:hypothetical protein
MERHWNKIVGCAAIKITDKNERLGSFVQTKTARKKRSSVAATFKS